MATKTATERAVSLLKLWTHMKDVRRPVEEWWQLIGELVIPRIGFGIDKNNFLW